MIKQFDKDIEAFRITFENFKFQFLFVNDNSLILKSFVFRSYRFRFFSSVTFVFLFISFVELTQQRRNRRFSFFDFFVFRANSVSIINIKIFDNFKQFISSNQSITRQLINFTSFTSTITNIIIIEN